jgi:hypothetical protein
VQLDVRNGKAIGKSINISTKDFEWREEINGGINGKKNMSLVESNENPAS